MKAPSEGAAGISEAQEERTRILVTGARGFVGRHLIAHLLTEGSAMASQDGAGGGQAASIPEAERVPQIVAAVHSDAASPAGDRAGWDGQAVPGRVEVVPLDICDAQAVRELVARVRPHQIYHLAARASWVDVERSAVFAVNVAGTRNLLEAAGDLSPFPRALLVSTCYVYGNTDPARPAREEDPVGPLWRFSAYTDSKIEMEAVARAYRGFVLVARACAHTGPGQSPTYALPNFARQLARIERGLEPPVLHVGNLEAQRDLLDVRDVVRAYGLLMAQGVCGEVYNVATGHPVTMQAALDRLRALCAVPTEVQLDPARLRSADIACSTGDPTKLRTATGWQPRYSLEQTLRDTLNYWRAEVAS